MFCKNKPEVALLKLYRDARHTAFPVAFSKIPKGHTLVIETHLFQPSMLTKLPIKPEYKVIKPNKLQECLAKFTIWFTAIIRPITGKGQHEANVHTWYRLSFKITDDFNPILKK
jgi:hypothetical protein